MYVRTYVHMYVRMYVRMYAPSYLRQFHMYEAEMLQACPGAHGDGSYIKTIQNSLRWDHIQNF